ncbi:MAG: type VI secretion system baseplate subunit TssG [Acetobacteraceae bacterium]|nr:type VI secretion system baseplate subunit TssG [Acetobacteraceae bacterium]
MPPAKAPVSPYTRLIGDPRRFRFDAALRVLAHAAGNPDPAHAARFRALHSLAYPGAEVHAAEPPSDGRPPLLTLGVIGLTGPAGVLPRFYTEMLLASLRNRSPAMADFLDLVAHRFIAGFAEAGTKYRLHRAADTAHLARQRDRITTSLLALVGYATPHLAERVAAGSEPLLHYAGFFAMRPRSAERLRALVSDWLGRPVQVQQFSGAWLALPRDQRTAMPAGRVRGAHNRLGIDATIGIRAWDPQARIVLRLGPLDRASFEALLPDRPGMHRLVSLVRAFVGLETGFAVNPVLAGEEVPPLCLASTADPPPRLGWNTWVPVSGLKKHDIKRPDAADAVFEANVVESFASKQSACASCDLRHPSGLRRVVG